MTERRERKGEIDLTKCRQFEVANFNPVWSPLSDKVQTRYLKDDAYKAPGELFTRYRSQDQAVAKRLSPYVFNISELTNEVLDQLTVEGKGAEKDFGSAVLTISRLEELVKELSADETQKIVDTRSDLIKAAQESKWPLNNGWQIFDVKDSDKPMLVVSKKTDTGIRFDTVMLDELHKKNPEALPFLIRHLNEKSALGSLENHLDYYEEVHGVGERDIVPTFLRELVQRNSSDTEIESLANYLKWMGSLGQDYATVMFNFQDTLAHVKVDLKSTRRIDLPHYLKHIASCPSIPAETSKRIKSISKAYNLLTTADDQYPKNGLNETILKNPTHAFLRLDEIEQNSQNDLSQNSEAARLASRLMDKESEALDREAFFALLKEEFPKFHETLVKFEQWLGNDLMKRSNFNELISDTRRWLHYQTPSLDSISKNLYEQLGHIVKISRIEENFDGIFLPKGPQDSVWISNIPLATVLPLLVIKEDQASLAKDTKDFFGNKSRTIENYNKLLGEFKTEAEQKVAVAKEELGRVEATRKAVKEFKAKAKISDREMSNLINSVSEMVTGKDGVTGLRTDHYRFTILFNTLVMHKMGVINMDSPVFKEFFNFVFPPRERV